MPRYSFLVMLLLIGIAVGCRHEQPIDEVFRWPSSGVPEADSLILEMQRGSLVIDTPVKDRRYIEIRMCSLAQRHPNNIIVQSRAQYMHCIMADPKDIPNDSMLTLISIEKSKLDSVNHTYDWYQWKSLEVDYEVNTVRKYMKITDCLLHFKKTGNLFEEGRTLVQLGNLMKECDDTVQAKAYYLEAYKIFQDLNQKKNMLICQLNISNTIPNDQRESSYIALLNDSAARKLGHLQIWVMQNYVLESNKIEYIDSALQIAANPSYFSGNNHIEEVAFLLAMKGNYYDQHLGEHAKGKNLILQGFNSITTPNYPTRYLHMMHKLLGAAYGNMGNYDSAAFHFYHALMWSDSLNKELRLAEFSGLDTRNRIELIKNSMTQQRNQWIWILSSVFLCIISICIIFMINLKRRQALKEVKQLQMQEKLQKSIQSVKIQTMVIEENEKLIDGISNQITELRQSGEIDMASAGALTRIMKLHKTDSEIHKGLLEVQKELNNDFTDKLKTDFPSLSDGQIKLASLIAIGMESPQICRILGIQLSSLHKSRYRLRTRLGLNNDDSLEEFLRNRNKATI